MVFDSWRVVRRGVGEWLEGQAGEMESNGRNMIGEDDDEYDRKDDDR